MRIGLSPLVTAIAALLTACSTTTAVSVPDVPAALRAPAGQAVYLEALATGVQIYECGQKSDGSYEWIFKAPEASLATRAGQPLGRHYAGPTWEATDGSSVVGEVKAKDPGPVAAAIPWLLLAAKSNSGTGVLGDARSIQRVATSGGIVPKERCDAGTLHKVARVPYAASYYFYH